MADLTGARRATAEGVIASVAGADATLRDDQATAGGALCAPGARVLVVQATGWGKSAVYWAATAVRRAEGAGPTLVISPRSAWSFVRWWSLPALAARSSTR